MPKLLTLGNKKKKVIFFCIALVFRNSGKICMISLYKGSSGD